jgi:NAD(P)-dependent dehydrogenase (short-subunit alcohol dehydrogenase family)
MPVNIEAKSVLVLGGYGLVGTAVCRKLVPHSPGKLIIASLRRWEAESRVEALQEEFPSTRCELVPVWGDMLLRAEWQSPPEGVHPREAVLAASDTRGRLIADIFDELDAEILESSLLYQLVMGLWGGRPTGPVDVVIDCVNTATAVAYQNVFGAVSHMRDPVGGTGPDSFREQVDHTLASLYIPQLVRHMQILYESLRRADTQAYVKVGTSGTGGMGFNIPYTHGEERPSRMLLSKAAIAGSQTMLIWLLARTTDGPQIVKEVKPTAAIAWKEIGFGPIRTGGREIPLYDCPPERAYDMNAPSTLESRAECGERVAGVLESVYIDTGENGMFSASEFAAITALGQMAFVTPEEIADNVVVEITGGNTGRDVIAGMDATATGPSYRAAYLREAAIYRLDQLQAEHGVESVAFEILGPPRLSKLLFEAHLLKVAYGTIYEAARPSPTEMSGALTRLIRDLPELRQEMISVGIPILLADGEHLLRGPVIKSSTADLGWVDLRPENMARWQGRLRKLANEVERQLRGDSSSRYDRIYRTARRWQARDSFDIGEVVGWLFVHEEHGGREKY